LNGQVYVDDFHFNNLFSGQIQAKAAGQAGLSWTPKRSLLSRLDFDYTMVLPYTYSHWGLRPRDRYNGLDGNNWPGGGPTNTDIQNAMNPPSSRHNRRPNNLNYTHLGRNLGPDLLPNSDRVSLRTRWNIISGVDINLSGYLTRHGNASEGVDFLDQRLHDGGLGDDGTSDAWLVNRNYEFHDRYMPGLSAFLNQSVLETRLGGGIGVTWTIPSSFGTFAIIAEYGAEYGWNRRVEVALIGNAYEYLPGGPLKGNNGLYHFWSIGGRWSW
jgi:hypothetical protein